MSAPTRRPVVPKLGNSFLTRQLSLQSPTPTIQQPLQQNNQQLTHQHRKLAFRRQSSEDLSLRRGRRRGRDTPSPAPSSATERGKCKNPPSTPPNVTSGGASDEKRANTASDRSSDVRWSGKQDPPAIPASPSLFNRHFPPSKEHPPCPAAAAFPVGGGGPVAGRPITPARPRPVRLAWAEKRSATVQPAPPASDLPHPPEDPTEDDAPVEVVAKKMGQPKPVTGSVLKAQLVKNQHSLPSMAVEDSVLQTRQQLADKLRRAWWGEDQLRPNLDIFLTCLANDSNGGECTPPGEESTKEGVQKSQKENTKEDVEIAMEQRESKMISIKIDTVASENSSREGDNDDPVSSNETKVSLVSGSLSKGANGRPRPTAQVPHQSPSPSKSTSSASPSSSKGHSGVLTSSNEPSASSNPSASHAAGNEFARGAETCEKVKDSIPFGQGCGDGGGSVGGCLPETAPPREPATPTVTFLQTSAPTFPSGFVDATTASQVTNGFSTQSGKGVSEIKREVTPVTTAKTQTAVGQGSEGKASGVGSASLRRAQFRNSSMNRRTLTRSADSNPPSSGPERGPTGGGSASSGPMAPGMAAVVGSSRTTTCTWMAPNSNAVDAIGRAREEAMKSRRGVQQVQESTAERNPWKRNAESAGITRASTVDGESSQAVEFGTPSPSSASPSAASSIGPVQARPSTATARPADRTALRSAPSFVTAAAAKHRQKTSSKRRPVRRSTEDDEGAEGEGTGEDMGVGSRGPGGYPRGKGGVRGAHADVVTMVSLVSPTGSDTEEPLPQVFSFPRDPAATAPAVPTPLAVSSRAQSARRGGVLSRMLSMDATPERSTTTQRKLHKSVSFQSDLLPDDEEDVFSRRPAFPASLIIPRIPACAPPGINPASSHSSPPPPSTSSPAGTVPAAAPKASSAAPVIIPPSLSQHVPKIVDPCTPRSTYSPPSPPSRAAGPGHSRTAGSERPSTAAGGTAVAAAGVAGGAPDHVVEEDAAATNGSAAPGEKGRLNRKRVMFRSRSASLRGSEEDHAELKERTGSRGSQSSHVSVNHGNHGGGSVLADGAAADKSHTSASDAAAGKQRGLAVTLSERQDGASSKPAEDRTRGARGSVNAGGVPPRPSTAGGSRGSKPAEKGKRDDETGSGKDEEGEETEIQKPEFKSAKEKECWELYRRMCDKGLTVSYDTILRGMLTPTEYRMRRNALLSTC